MVKLLVVDDELSICDLLQRFFMEKNYQVFTATDAESALSIVKKEHPHIVLLDIVMPGESGIDILSKIKEINKDTKVIMLTAVVDDRVMEQLKKAGASEYITKPFSLEKLEKDIMPKILKQLI